MARFMPNVHFTANLPRHLDCPTATVGGGTVRAALESVFAENPRLRGYLLDDQGRVRKHVNIFVRGTPVSDRVRLTDPAGPDDEIYVFQALSGG